MVSGIGGAAGYAVSINREQIAGRGFKKADADGSGKIDSSELTELFAKISERTGKSLDASEMMKQYDKDGDGALGKDEMNSMMESLVGKVEPRGGMGPMAGMGGPRGGGGPGGPPPGGGFEEDDEDGDGTLDSEELETVLSSLSKVTGTTYDTASIIKQYDKDEDGVLSQDEAGSMMKSILGDPGEMPAKGTATNKTSSDAIAAYGGNQDSSILLEMLKSQDENKSDMAKVISFFQNYREFSTTA